MIPMPSTPVIQVRDLNMSFSGVKALEEVRIDVMAGCVHVLMGENGAGKSTLMKILAGLLKPDSGEIRFNGEVIHLRNPHDALRRGIAMIHQELMPFRDLTVAANIGMGRELVRKIPGWIDHKAMDRQATEILSRLGSNISASRRMGDLSVAEMQVVEIAKALAHHASVIIMDEPTTALSGREVDTLFGVIRDLKQHGVAILFISHKMDEIFQIADTITVMRDGREIDSRPSHELDEPELIRLMVGRDPGTRSCDESRPGETALVVRDLTKRGKFYDISFSLHRGEILGISGLMGAGRTELMHAIYGLDPADSGEIQVSGMPTCICSPIEAIQAGIALVSEDRKKYGFVPQMSVRENLTLSSLPSGWIDASAEAVLADQQIQTFAIKTSSRDQPVVHLSGGNQQKVVIAKALLNKPTILILDEPTRGIDIGAKSEIYTLITQFARSGMAVLLVSSELPELLSLSDRLLVMRGGRLSAELDPRHASQEDIMRHAMPS